jgi:restriction system protein
VVEVKYEPNRNTLEEVPVSQAWVAETYAGLAIKIALRTIYELFQSDVANALTSVAFNGRIRGIDKSTGQDTNVFVISVEASKAEFTTMNLAQVDPKACFIRLKGILSNNLTERTPIAPIRFASSVTQ